MINVIEHENFPGFLLVPDFVDRQLERGIIALATPLLNRRAKSTAYFGYGYFPSHRWLGAIPYWLDPSLLRKLSEFPYPGRENLDSMNAVQIRRYIKGDESTSHFDRFDFSNEIAVLSLGGEGRVEFRRPSDNHTHTFIIPPRSLYIMRDDARYVFQHAVLPAQETRYSIVMRTALDSTTNLPLPKL